MERTDGAIYGFASGQHLRYQQSLLYFLVKIFAVPRGASHAHTGALAEWFFSLLVVGSCIIVEKYNIVESIRASTFLSTRSSSAPKSQLSTHRHRVASKIFRESSSPDYRISHYGPTHTYGADTFRRSLPVSLIPLAADSYCGHIAPAPSSISGQKQSISGSRYCIM